MKKAFIAIIALFGLAFGAITIAKRRSSESAVAAAVPADAARQRIRDFWAVYNRANGFRIQGDFARAVPAYHEALQLDPRHEDSLYYLGASLEELGDYAGAAESFRLLIALNPLSGRALGELGHTLSVLEPGAPGDFAGARQALLRNVEVNREQAGPFIRLGLLELDQGRPDAAAEQFRLASGFGSPEGTFLFGYARFLQKRYREAIPYFQKVVDSYWRDRKAAAKGVTQEGDILPAPGKPLTSLARAGFKSLLFLYWSAQRLGGYPASVPREFRIHPAELARSAALATSIADLGPSVAGGRVVSLDLDQAARPGLLVVGPNQPLRLYRREGERLEDVTAASGLRGIDHVWDADSVDYDGDGYQDLYLIRSGFLGAGENLLYHHNRDGTFSDATRAMGLTGARATAHACFADFEGNGRPDLVEAGASDGHHAPLRFFRNNGQRFIDATAQAGFAARNTAVDCAVADFDGDGRPDLFVTYWRQGAVLYRNLGNGKFQDVTEQAGLGDLSGESFGALFFDYDRDGKPDLLVTRYAPYEDVVRCLLQPAFQAPWSSPRLFHNLGQGRFEDVTRRAGLERAYGTLAAVAADVDGDGWPDLLMVNGSLDAQRLEPSVVLRNLQGQAFREWSYLPSFDFPGNYFAATALGSRGLARIYLAPHAPFREVSPDGRSASPKLAAFPSSPR